MQETIRYSFFVFFNLKTFLKNNSSLLFFPPSQPFEKRFPLHDKERLEKWLRNMKRDAWTPSKHQLLCSDHFTPDSLDVRWGIRYLKHTAVPTIFSSPDDEVTCSYLFYDSRNLSNCLCNNMF